MVKSTKRDVKRSVNYETDSGYAWIVVGACFVIYALIIGNIRSFGVIYVAILENFNVSREDASWPVSLLYAVMFFTSIISGTLSNYFSSRVIISVGCLCSAFGIMLCFIADSIFQLSIFIGLVEGFGCGLVNTQLPIIINQYFVKLRGTASGFAFAGGTAGAFLLPLLVEYLLIHYTLQDCFLIIGGLTLNAIPAALLLRPPVSAKSPKCALMTEEDAEITVLEFLTSENSESDISNTSVKKHSKTALIINQYLSDIKCLSKNSMYVMICILHAVFMWSWTTLTLIVVDFAVDRGLQLNEAVALLSAFAASDLIGRTTVGYITDKKIVERPTVAFIAILMIGVVSSITPLVPNTFFALTAASLCLGLFTGSLIILFGVLIVECVDMQKVPIAIGISFSFFGFVALLRPEIIGYFRDVCKSYDRLFYAVGGTCVVTAIIWFLIVKANRKRNAQKIDTET